MPGATKKAATRKKKAPAKKAPAKKAPAKKPPAKKPPAKKAPAKKPTWRPAKKAPAKKPTWRPARVGDRADVTALSLALYAEDPSDHAVSARGISATLRRLEAEPARGQVVVVDGDVDGRVGVVAYAILASFWSNELGGEVCTIDELYVRPGSRNAGLGSTLIRSLSAGSVRRFQRAVALELEVTSRNLRARALYERLGFRVRKNSCLRLVRR